MNILFLNVGRRVELVQAFRQALGQRGGGLIAGSDISSLAPALAAVDEVVCLPATDAPDFAAALGDLHRRRPFDLLIPTIDPDLERLDAARDRVEAACPGMRLLLPSSFTVRQSRDKRLSRERFRSLGALVPEALTTIEAAHRLPVFAKPPNGSASQGCGVIHTPEELNRRLHDAPDLMLEAIVEGPEITVDVLCDFTGRALTAVPRRRLRVRGGEVSQGVVESDSALEALARRLAEGFQATGPVTIQFRRPAAGQFVAMELNARMGGGLPLTIAAGADWPGWILDLCQGRQPAISGQVEDGLVMTRFDRSVFVPSPPRPLRRIPSDALRAVIFDLDDTLYPEADFVLGGYRAVARRVWRDHRVEIGAELRGRFLRGDRGDLFSPALLAAGLEPDEGYVRELVEVYRRHSPHLRPHLDAEAVGELRQAGFAIGLVSDGALDVQRRKWQALGLAAKFDSVVFSDALGGRDCWKPSPRPYERCLAELGVAAGEACYVGDNLAKDFVAPRHLGMYAVRVARLDGLHAHRLAPAPGARPHATIRSLTELAELLGRSFFPISEPVSTRQQTSGVP